MTARCCGIRDICAITGYSRGKVLAALSSTHQTCPERTHYQTLQVDEFWTFVGKKRNKAWLVYAWDQESGKMVAHV